MPLGSLLLGLMCRRVICDACYDHVLDTCDSILRGTFWPSPSESPKSFELVALLFRISSDARSQSLVDFVASACGG